MVLFFQRKEPDTTMSYWAIVQNWVIFLLVMSYVLQKKY